MNWKSVVIAIGGFILGLILLSTVTSILIRRKVGSCPAIQKGKEILNSTDKDDNDNDSDLL